MVIYIPPEFESHLRIDYTRIKVIHMNSAFPCNASRVGATRATRVPSACAHRRQPASPPPAHALQ